MAGGIGKVTVNVLSGNPLGGGRDGVEYTPVVGSLIYGPSEGGSRIVDKFYKDYDRAQMLSKAAGIWDERKAKPKMKISKADIRLVGALPAMRAIANDLSAMRGELADVNLSKEVSAKSKHVANMKYTWMSRVAAGILYGQPIPKVPAGVNVSDIKAQELVDYYINMANDAIENAKKREGGPV